MIKLEKVSKKFGVIEVLKKVNLKVNDGDLIFIEGSNGSGKSTLLKLIAGLLEPDNGIVDTENRYIGALIENPSFIENETALYNLQFLYNLRSKFNKKNVEKNSEYLNIDINIPIPIKKYSIGMRQKIGIIQAVMENQQIILLDEPSRGLDKESVSGFFELVKDLHSEGRTIVICAHDGVDGISFTHRYELKNGKINTLY